MLDNSRRLTEAGSAQFSSPGIQVVYLEDLFLSRPRRRLWASTRDLGLIVFGWLFFLGLLAYPIAHLIGFAACALAFVLLPAERR